MIDSHHRAVQTTGYTWDGDIQEFNNLLPKIWLSGFNVTIVFAICLWLLYPTWPMGKNYTKGYLNQISYQSGEATIFTHWNSRALLLHTLQKKDNIQRRQEYLQRIASTSFQEIMADTKLTKFSYSMARSIFSDNCAPCHGGNPDIFTRLSKDNPIWDGTAILHGHSPASELIRWPNRKNRFSVSEIKALSVYVQQMPTKNAVIPQPK